MVNPNSICKYWIFFLRKRYCTGFPTHKTNIAIYRGMSPYIYVSKTKRREISNISTHILRIIMIKDSSLGVTIVSPLLQSAQPNSRERNALGCS